MHNDSFDVADFFSLPLPALKPAAFLELVYGSLKHVQAYNFQPLPPDMKKEGIVLKVYQGILGIWMSWAQV